MFLVRQANLYGSSKFARLRGTLYACTILAGVPIQASAQENNVVQRLEALEERLETIEEQNDELRAENARLRAERQSAPPSADQITAVDGEPQLAARGDVDVVVEADDPREIQVAGSENFVGTNGSYAFRILDQAVDVTTKPQVQLQALRDGELSDRVTLSGQITGIANAQKSNRDSKFGYLLRHPTSANQIGEHVSEAVLHSAHLALTARLTPDLTGYMELLYDPEQSFGGGTITALNRNQIQLRRGWIMWGNLDQHPVYALLGKMDTPFGLNDTVSPFTNSTNWHAFAGLAYGAQAGFLKDGFHLRAMAIQGGAQFRAANTSVGGTNVPSRLNNFAVDARYHSAFGPGPRDGLLVGASYLHGSAYCQGYPVFHFNPCEKNNPAVAAYAKLDYGGLQLLGEYAQTLEEWPGSAVPIPMNPLSVFDPVKTRSFTVGGRYGFGPAMTTTQERAFALSAEFSKFIAGEDGAPWERQNQIVLGSSWFVVPNVNLFAEYIHVDGFVPLNFLSGGNFPDGSTWSEKGAKTDVIMIGASAAF